MLATKHLTVAIDLHTMEKKHYGSQWLPSTVWFLWIMIALIVHSSHMCIFLITTIDLHSVWIQ